MKIKKNKKAFNILFRSVVFYFRIISCNLRSKSILKCNVFPEKYKITTELKSLIQHAKKKKAFKIHKRKSFPKISNNNFPIIIYQTLFYPIVLKQNATNGNRRLKSFSFFI